MLHYVHVLFSSAVCIVNRISLTFSAIFICLYIYVWIYISVFSYHFSLHLRHLYVIIYQDLLVVCIINYTNYKKILNSTYAVVCIIIYIYICRLHTYIHTYTLHTWWLLYAECILWDASATFLTYSKNIIFAHKVQRVTYALYTA